jgi:hypothetical protein
VNVGVLVSPVITALLVPSVLPSSLIRTPSRIPSVLVWLMLLVAAFPLSTTGAILLMIHRPFLDHQCTSAALTMNPRLGLERVVFAYQKPSLFCAGPALTVFLAGPLF